MKLGFLGERASLDQTRLSNRRNFHCTFYRHVPKRCERELTRCQEITLQTYWLIRHLWDFQTRQQLARVCRETPMPRSQTQVSVQQQDRSFNQSLVNAQCTKSNLKQQGACQLRSIARSIPRLALHGLLNYTCLVSDSGVELFGLIVCKPRPVLTFPAVKSRSPSSCTAQNTKQLKYATVFQLHEILHVCVFRL